MSGDHQVSEASHEPSVYQEASIDDVLARYEVGGTIGIGGFAVVKYGVDKLTGNNVAIKVVDKTRYASGDSSLEREIRVLAQVDHPNCIKLYAVYMTPRKVYIITELVTGGELLDRVVDKGNYSELDAAKIIKQILSGVEYLHKNGIVHRDLKLENMVMLDISEDSPVKIADFGLSKFFAADSVMQTMCGSPQYVAPEILGIGEGLQAYTFAVDMWSVGVILFILLAGYQPFGENNDDEGILFENIKAGRYYVDDVVWADISKDAKDLVAALLTVDPEKRYTASQALQHPWITKNAHQNFKADRQQAPITRLSSTSFRLREQLSRRQSSRQLVDYQNAASRALQSADEELDHSKHNLKSTSSSLLTRNTSANGASGLPAQLPLPTNNSAATSAKSPNGSAQAPPRSAPGGAAEPRASSVSGGESEGRSVGGSKSDTSRREVSGESTGEGGGGGVELCVRVGG